jgi:outer membrane protein assembly factor BamB
MRQPLRTLLLAASLCLAAAFARAGDNWPQFRGPTGQGVTDSTGLPLTWGEGQNVKWKTPIHGRAWSSPVVWGSQIWLTTASEDGRYLSALCVDKETGKVVHDLKLFEDPTPNPVFKKFNTYASPTPVIEEGRVYITFGAAGTVCLDTATAKPVWERRDIKVNHFRGAGSSLMMYKDLLIFDFDGSDAQFVVALDKKTGETVWRTERSVDYGDLGPDGKPKADGDYRKAFSTCRIATVNGKPAVISLGSKATYAYEPETGKEIWRLDHKDYHSGAATPVVGDGLIYIAPGYGAGGLLAIKADGQGALGAGNVAFKITKNAPNKPSPLLLGSELYFVSDNGFASCVDAKTGKEHWRERVKGNFSAAPLAGDGKIYFFGEDGTTTVVAPGTQFKKLAENKLEETQRTMAVPAVSGKALFVRGGTALYRIEQ